MACLTRLKLLSWNVFGLSQKLKDTEFVNILKENDIVCLTETWTTIQSNIKLNSYECIHRMRKKKRKRGRPSGGIILYYKSYLKPGITEIVKSHEDILWIKLSRKMFGFEKDVYMCTVYNNPNCRATENCAFLQLQRDVEHFSKLGDILLNGDFNARTGNLNDYIKHDYSSSHIQTGKNYSLDKTVHNTERENKDNKINSWGRELMVLCKSAGLRILNGRTIGDLFGDYTYFKGNKKSAVDYVIVSKHWLGNILHFSVSEPIPYLSDHCFLNTVIKCSINKAYTPEKQSNMKKLYNRFIWKAESKELFRNALMQEASQRMLVSFMSTNYEHQSCETATSDFTSILINAGLQSLKVKAQNKQRSNTVKQKWFDSECFTFRQNIRRIGKKIKIMKQPSQEKLFDLNSSSKKYKKLLRKKKQEYKQKLVHEMTILKTQDPKLYWNILEQLRECDQPYASEHQNTKVSAEKFYEHFKQLSCNDITDTHQVEPKLCQEENSKYDVNKCDLDYAFTMKEIRQSIYDSKTGKSPSDDMILNEMLRCSCNIILPALTKLFNLLLHCEYFPDLWNISYQVPLFKDGDCYDPNNFRGISITSCLGKIFNRTLNKRLQHKVEQEKKLHDSQAAYRTDHSTVDQIFILKCLLNKYVQVQKKALYVCFVDFRKAFDNIWHTGLLYKLIKDFKIGGKFYGLIKNMYSNAKSCVKLETGITESFPLHKGIKQGDTLSPYLFNLYLNDLNNLFHSRTTDAPTLGEKFIGCLMYADDLVVISQSAKGLQTSLDRLYDYCQQWKLKLNIKKTKVMVIKKRKITASYNFIFGTDTLAEADSYNYLGLLINHNGSFTEAVQALKNKSYKALFQMTSSLYTGLTFSPDIPLKIFDSTVRPILTYGCEAWASDYIKLLSHPMKNDKMPFEQVNNKFCKYILNVKNKASNFAVKAEVGREPVFAYICSQTLKYWLRIMNMSSDRLVRQAYLSELEIHFSGKHSWATFIVEMLKTYNLQYLWTATDHSEHQKNIKTLKRSVRETSKKIYFDKNFSSVTEKCKLRTFVQFKNNSILEPYLTVCDVPQSWRRLYCNFRISSHDLEIERGRYSTPKKPVEERICKLCGLETETEQHFILSCPVYIQTRKSFTKEIRQIESNFYNMNHTDRFIFLLTSGNEEIIKLTMKFIYTIYQERKALLLS